MVHRQPLHVGPGQPVVDGGHGAPGQVPDQLPAAALAVQEAGGVGFQGPVAGGLRQHPLHRGPVLGVHQVQEPAAQELPGRRPQSSALPVPTAWKEPSAPRAKNTSCVWAMIQSKRDLEASSGGRGSLEGGSC